MDRRRIIGKTEEGLDLYGFSPNDLGTNAGLPRIRVRALDGMAALDDLEVMCTFDGVRISIPRHPLWEDDYGDSTAAEIVLAIDEAVSAERHVERCEIVARQRSTGGSVVLRYRFSIAPIQGFRLKDMNLDFGCAVATYEFQAVQDIVVETAQSDRLERRLVTGWGPYEARTLLSDEFLGLSISSPGAGKTTNVRLALAAISIEVPKFLLEIEKDRPVCLADSIRLKGASSIVKVSSGGNRYNRRVLVTLGGTAVFYREMRRAESHLIELFNEDNKHLFSQQKGRTPCDKSLEIVVFYGDDASGGRREQSWAEMPLLACREGIGIRGVRTGEDADGHALLLFDGEPLCGVHMDFVRRVGGRKVAEATAPAGSSAVEIPDQVARLIRTEKKVSVLIAPMERMNKKVLNEWAVKYDISRP